MNVSEAPIFGKKADRADCTPAFDSTCLALAVATCGFAVVAVAIASSKESLPGAVLWPSNGNTPAVAKAIAQMSFNFATGSCAEKKAAPFVGLHCLRPFGYRFAATLIRTEAAVVALRSSKSSRAFSAALRQTRSHSLKIIGSAIP